jgi:hypothetical protein
MRKALEHRDPSGPSSFHQGDIECRRLVSRKQMRVAGQREGGRVVAEGAAELEEVGAAPEMERSEGMAERVEAGPGRSCLPHERLEDPWPQVGRVERRA